MSRIVSWGLARLEARPTLQAVEPGRGHAARAQHLGKRGLVEQAGRGQAHQHLVGLAEAQVALAQQAVVAAEVVELHTHRVRLREQFAHRGDHLGAVELDAAQHRGVRQYLHSM